MIGVSVCLFVCLPVCLRISKNTHPNFTKFSVHITSGRGADGNAICYVRAALSLTSSFHKYRAIIKATRMLRPLLNGCEVGRVKEGKNEAQSSCSQQTTLSFALRQVKFAKKKARKRHAKLQSWNSKK